MTVNSYMAEGGDRYSVLAEGGDRYSVLAEGGDRYSVLADGTDKLGGALDLDALIAYFANTEAVAPGPQNRITRLN